MTEEEIFEERIGWKPGDIEWVEPPPDVPAPPAG